MPAFYDDTDLLFGWNGDFQLSGGDFKSTEFDGLQSLLDQLHSLCASTLGDWAIYPNRGVGLEDFIGEPNTRQTGDRIRERIALAIIGAELVAEQDLEVRVIPVHINKVLVVIKVHALPTAFNNLDAGNVLQTSLVFDSLEQEIFFLDKTPNFVS